MKFNTLTVALSALSCVEAAGSGPYPAEYTTIPALPNHTIYRPSTVPPGLSLPVVVWGNGACSANGTYFANLLHEVASHGFFVIANGLPNDSGRTTSDLQMAALDWVTSSAAPDFVDSSRISASGQSCGGLESYEFSQDNRVSVLGIFNSGFLRVLEAYRTVPGIRKPIFYFVGGEEDIAFSNAERDFRLLPDSTPSWKGNLPVGHFGTYAEPNAGAFGVAAVQFFKWTLGGDADAAQWFTSDGAEAEGWDVETQSLEDL